MSKPVGPSKKRKLSPTLNQPPIKRKMTDEEKHELGRELEDMLGDLPDNIIEFLGHKVQTEAMKRMRLKLISMFLTFTLRKLLNDHLQVKQPNQAKSEPCEMEMVRFFCSL